MQYVLMTDSDSDLPYELKMKYDIPVIYMPYSLDGKEYYDDLGQMLDHKSYYQAMRNGAAPVTSGLNKSAYLEYFEPVLKGGQDLLLLAFSSKMSSTLQEAYAAQAELKERYPDRRLEILDTLSISGPQTLLVLQAFEMYHKGADMDSVIAWVKANYARAQAFITVDDLKYLKRGGRISGAAAMVGQMLSIKPIIVESKDGRLLNVDKVRGRRMAIDYIADNAVDNIVDPTESVGIILHADCIDDALTLRDKLLAKLPTMNIRIDPVGPVIGAHIGPGTLAFCFMGKQRPY